MYFSIEIPEEFGVPQSLNNVVVYEVYFFSYQGITSVFCNRSLPSTTSSHIEQTEQE